MTNLITLTIPNDDHVALRAFGKALEEMALAHGAPLQLKINEEALSKALDELQQAAPRMMQVLRCEDEELQGKRKEPEVDTTAQQVESLVRNQQSLGEDFEKVLVDNIDELYVESTPTTDKTGTPWGERIHSASKALNSDGTWRLRRKPTGMEEAEWAALIAGVKEELKYREQVKQETEQSFTDEPTREEVDELIEASNEMPATIEPPVTPPGDDFHTDAGVVTEQTVASIPPIPVPPPVVVTPVPVADEAWDFPKLMKFLTERHGKIDVLTVNQLLAVDGLAALTDLNAHPDKIGPFVARVKAHLGE